MSTPEYPHHEEFECRVEKRNGVTYVLDMWFECRKGTHVCDGQSEYQTIEGKRVVQKCYCDCHKRSNPPTTTKPAGGGFPL